MEKVVEGREAMKRNILRGREGWQISKGRRDEVQGMEEWLGTYIYLHVHKMEGDKEESKGER